MQTEIHLDFSERKIWPTNSLLKLEEILLDHVLAHIYCCILYAVILVVSYNNLGHQEDQCSCTLVLN